MCQFILQTKRVRSAQKFDLLEEFESFDQLRYILGRVNQKVMDDWKNDKFRQPQCLLRDVNDNPSAVVYIIGRINETE